MGMLSRLRHRLGWSAPLAFAGLIVPTVASAQGAFPVDQTYQTISSWTLVIAQFLDILTWFVFSFLIFLLDPYFMFDMTNGKAGSLMTVLNEIWQLSRDLMNIAFAVGLVGAAIYTVVTANKEFISQHLKNFVMAVVLVNFSWFIPLVVLDIANIATVTVYSIPSAIVNPLAECTYTSTTSTACFEPNPAGAAAGEPRTCACKAVADFVPFPDKATTTKLKAQSSAWDCNIGYCVKYVKLDPLESTKHGTVINGLVVNHARLSQLAVITRTKQDSKIADMLLFILREMFVIVIHVALFFPLLALLLALVIRIPIMWFTLAFMPFYFLSWVIPEEIPILGEVKSKAKGIWDMYVKAAFIPAVVAVPLTVGFIMANAGSRVSFAGMNQIPFNLIDGMGSFAQLLWVVMVLAILWSGTFGALEFMMADLPGAGMIGKIKSTGEDAGKLAAELPLSAVPIPGPGNLLNLSTLMKPSALRQALRSPGGLQEHFSERGRQRTVANEGAQRLIQEPAKETKMREAVTAFTDAAQHTEAEFDKLRRALQDNAGVTVTRETVSGMIQDMNKSLKDAGRQELITNSTKFNDGIDKMLRNTTQPQAPAQPAPGSPPPAPNPAP